MGIRIENRIKPKPWVRIWMFWLVAYPWIFVANVFLLPFRTVDDVRDQLFEWDFPEKRKKKVR